MFSKSVKSQGFKRGRVKSKGKDRRSFSRTADRTDPINSNSSARPMRGGIRL